MTDTCKRIEKKNYDEIRVEIEPGRNWWWTSNPEMRVRHLDDWARELTEFFRDHRSQNVNSVTVVVPVFDACSACGDVWDTDTFDEDPETGEPCEPYVGCASCCLPLESHQKAVAQ